MGLFALRKADHSSASVNQDESSPPRLPDKSVAQLIRARFQVNGRKKRGLQLGQSGPSSSTPEPVIRNQDHESYAHKGSDSSTPPRGSCQLEGQRVSSDVVTITLAQRLNELAAAHEEGLLSEDDYRVLRQNLFNTFAPHSAPPVETPVVKSVEPISLRLSSTSRSNCSTVNSVSVRAPSLLTQTTNGSSVSTLFNRLWKRSSQDRVILHDQDRASVLSSSSRMTMSLVAGSNRRELSRQASDGSLRTARSQRLPPDLRSVSSRRSMRSITTTSDLEGRSRGSTRSLRGNDPPPSSFNSKFVSSRLISLDGNGDRLRSAAEIRAEIHATEAEQQNVLAAFSLLTRPQLDPTSVGFTHASNTRAGASDRFPHPSGLYRRYKSSTSERYRPSKDAATDKMPLQSQGAAIYKSRYDGFGITEDTHAAEIERRRSEINMRYQQRLDYLRARLKGAEIHERLLQK